MPFQSARIVKSVSRSVVNHAGKAAPMMIAGTVDTGRAGGICQRRRQRSAVIATEVAGWLHDGVHQAVARFFFDRDTDVLAGLREGLGDADFEQAMAEGAQLTVAEVVELTLTTLDALIEREAAE
jgi:hypothetical protein